VGLKKGGRKDEETERQRDWVKGRLGEEEILRFPSVGGARGGF
jgi:hypothetical protein